MLLASPDQAIRMDAYQNVLRRELSRLEQDQARLIVPPSQDLFEPRYKIPFHATPEIFFQISGSTRFVLPSGDKILESGDVLIMPKGVPHWETGSSAPDDYQIMVGMFLPDSFSFHLAGANAAGGLIGVNIDRFERKEHVQLANLVSEIATARQELGKAEHPQIRGLLMGYLGWALQNLTKPEESSPREPELVRRCREKVQLDLGQSELTVASLAKQLCCSSDHLARCFQHSTGEKLVGYIHQERMKRARKLLEETDLKIASIATECGFQSHSAFNRAFLKYAGGTPLAVRVAANSAV